MPYDYDEYEFGCENTTLYLDKMNDMFDANNYTDNGRVVVDYAPNCNVIVVKVLDKVETVNPNGLTDYGIMWAVLEKVKEMYDKR